MIILQDYNFIVNILLAPAIFPYVYEPWPQQEFLVFRLLISKSSKNKFPRTKIPVQ